MLAEHYRRIVEAEAVEAVFRVVFEFARGGGEGVRAANARQQRSRSRSRSASRANGNRAGQSTDDAEARDQPGDRSHGVKEHTSSRHDI